MARPGRFAYSAAMSAFDRFFLGCRQCLDLRQEIAEPLLD